MTIVDTGLDIAHPDFAGGPRYASEPSVAQHVRRRDLPRDHGRLDGGRGRKRPRTWASPDVRPPHLRPAGLDDATIIAALDRVASGGVVNLSLGGPGFSRALYEAVMRAVDRGALVVAAPATASTSPTRTSIRPTIPRPHGRRDGPGGRAGLLLERLRRSTLRRGDQHPRPGSGRPDSSISSPDELLRAIVSAVAAWVWSGGPSSKPPRSRPAARNGTGHEPRLRRAHGVRRRSLPRSPRRTGADPGPRRAERRRRPRGERTRAREGEPPLTGGGQRRRSSLGWTPSKTRTTSTASSCRPEGQPRSS